MSEAMKIGVTLRNMGPQSTPDTMRLGAASAEQRDFDSIWITDHIAIPPDDAEGSEGRYTDPLTTAAWLAAHTSKIHLGIEVLVIPYRPILPTLKQIATVQELSNNRLLLGAAVGWMDPEFKALGVDRHQRGKLTDEFLAASEAYFSNEVMTLNDQPFLTKPHPPAPTIYIGGGAPHALNRAVKFNHGWLPMTRDPEQLGADLKTFAEIAKDNNQESGPVAVMMGLPLSDKDAAANKMKMFRDLGIERLICAIRYNTIDEYQQQLDLLVEARSAAAG